MGTAAEGLATRVGFELPQRILWEHLDEFVLVREDELRDGDTADDRAHAQPRRGRGRRAARGGAEAARSAGRKARRARSATGGNVTLDQLRACSTARAATAEHTFTHSSITRLA